MAKSSPEYSCQSCGAVTRKWAGKCVDCGEWNSLSEGSKNSHFGQKNTQSGSVLTLSSLDENIKPAPRIHVGISELDRVLGGGLVLGSTTLIGGEPGIGKSTLLLQTVVALSQSGKSCLYITGEESIDQIQLRANRLHVPTMKVQVATATHIADIVATIAKVKPDVVIIDSIQTMYVGDISSSPGTVSQVRASTHALIQATKQHNIALILVGHVTKEGSIAGPKVLEHMVDTVLQFEGDSGLQFRILRALKNRFGPANEIGVFSMHERGLEEVPNPSSLFITGKAGETSGSVVFAGMEGTRPILVEIQALVSPSPMATPRRAVVGWDPNRLAMILAVLQTRCGFQLYDKEVYLNVAGGLKIQEPAADLAVASALMSALANIPLASEHVIFGEIGLSGEIRPVSHAENRLKEAAKLGFSGAIIPHATEAESKGLNLKRMKYISELAKLAKGQ